VQFVAPDSLPLAVMCMPSVAVCFNGSVFAEAPHALSFCLIKRPSASTAASHAPSCGSVRPLFQFDSVTRVMPASVAILQALILCALASLKNSVIARSTWVIFNFLLSVFKKRF
jgi:hypothetical protein